MAGVSTAQPGIPRYLQIRNDLRARIDAGEFENGQLLPAEPKLQEHYGVSRITLRKGVEELAKEGYVSKQPGRGTFVTHSSFTTSLLTLGGFGQLPEKFQGAPQRRVLEKLRTNADARVAALLEVQPGTPVVGLRRLLLDGENVIAYDVTHYPELLLPGFLDKVDDGVSTFAVLAADYGYAETTSGGTISAEVATGTEAELLGVAPGDPILRIDKVVRAAVGAEAGKPIAVSALRVDPYRVHVEF
jgi:DNA-binding GntR family transcriptional regulator